MSDQQTTRYERNNQFYKVKNLINYYKRRLERENLNDSSRNEYEHKINELTMKLKSIPFNKPEPRHRREETTAELYPQYTSLMVKRLRLIKKIREKKTNNLPYDVERDKLRDVVDKINNLPNENKPSPMPFTNKAKANLNFLHEVLDNEDLINNKANIENEQSDHNG